MKTHFLKTTLACLALSFFATSCDCDCELDKECDKPDFIITEGEITCPPNGNYQIGWKATVANKGVKGGNASVQAWLSKDKILGDDKAAGGLVFGTVAAGNTLTKTFGATVTDVQDYKYLILQVDHNALVEECDESNNIFVIKVPENYPESMCGPKTFKDITCEDIDDSKLSEEPILGSNFSGNILKIDDIIVYTTNKGRCGKLQILNIDDSENKKLTIRAVTYNSDGSVYSKTNALDIRGTWLCDLDEMLEEGGLKTEKDFWWNRLTKTDSKFTPKNGAKFYLYK